MLSRRKKIAAFLQGQGGQPEYIPTDLEGLQFWYDAYQITGLNNNDPVNPWPGLDPNNRDLSVGSDTLRPLYQTNILNGLPGVKFDGSNDILGNTDPAFDFIHQGASTLFFLINITNIAVQPLVDNANSATNNSTVGRYIRFNLVNGRMVLEDRIQNGGGTMPINFASPQGLEFTTGPCLLTLVLDPTLTSQHYKAYRNNVLIGTADLAASLSASEGAASFWIGRNNLNTSRFSGHHIELFGYNRALAYSENLGLTGGINFTVEP